MASSDRPGELPQVEKCVVDDDEEDEEEVRQMFPCFLDSFFHLVTSKLFGGNSLIIERSWIIFELLPRLDFRKIFGNFLVFFGNLRKTSRNAW